MTYSLRATLIRSLSTSILLFGIHTNAHAEMELEGNVLYMTRSASDGTPFSFMEGPATFGPIPLSDSIRLSSDDLDFDYELGFEALLNASIDSSSRIQFGGFWIDEHSDSAQTSRAGLDPFDEPFEPAWETDETCFQIAPDCTGGDSGNTDAYLHTLDLESHIWGLEANYEHDVAGLKNGDASVLVGLRYIDFDEDLLFTSFDEENDYLGLDTDISRYRIDTENRLLGVQGGVDMNWAIAERTSFSVATKGGIFANFAKQDTHFKDDDYGFDTATDQDGTNLATVMEGSAGLDFALSERVTLGVNYSMLYLNGVALAQDQFMRGQSYDSLRMLNTDGNVLYHGLNAGLRIALGPVPEGPALSSVSDIAVLPSNGSVFGGVLFMTREVDDDVVFSFVEGSSPFPEVDDAIALSTSDFDFDYEPGMTIGVAVPLSSGRALEVSGFWIDEHSDYAEASREGLEDIGGAAEPFEPAWETRDTSFCDASILTCFTDGDFTDAYLHTAELTSNIKGLEANLIQPLSRFHSIAPTLSLGLRYINFDESLGFISYDEEDGYLGLDDGIGRLLITTDNDLIGVQTGLDLDWDLGENVQLSLTGKGGVYANFAEQKRHFENGSSFPDPFIATGKSDGTDLAVSFETGAGLNLNVTDRVTLGLDYSMLYLGGVATAPDQFIRGQSFDSLEMLTQDGSVLYHGASARLKISFN